MSQLLAAAPWFGAVLAAAIAMFTLYAGVALAAALFHPDAATRRRAALLFRQLLGFWRPR